MKKTILITLSALILNLGLTLIPSPVGNFEAQAVFKDLKETQFSVGDNLDLDGSEEDNQQNTDYFDETDDKRSPIVKFAIRVIDFMTKVIGSIAMLLLIIAGFMFMVAQGDQQQIDNAKDVFKYAVIGLLITFFSYTIILLLQSLFSSS